MLIFLNEVLAIVVVERKRLQKLYPKLVLHYNLLLSYDYSAYRLPQKVLSEMQPCFLSTLVLVNEDEERPSLWLAVGGLDEDSEVFGFAENLCDDPLTKLLDQQHICKICCYSLPSRAFLPKQVAKHVDFVMVCPPYDI